MAKRDRGVAAEALAELEGSADRLSAWLEENWRVVAAAVAGILIVAGVAGWLASSSAGDEEQASAALAKTREDYLSAMGASPGTIEIPELANPDAAAGIRSEYEERFGNVAAEHSGTVAGTLAALEAAQLAAESGDDARAAGHVEAAAADAPAGAVRGLALQRLAQLHESGERWEAAADAHLSAASHSDYPLRGFALADAARARGLAGDPAGALELYERVEREFPDLELPEHQRLELLDLRAAQSAGGGAAGG